jgi:hypothetical protein
VTAERACHLVDLTALHTSVSLTSGYLQASAEANSRIAGRCRFSRHCGALDGGIESSWQHIHGLLDPSQSQRRIFGFTNFFWNRNLVLAGRTLQMFAN